jgi:galactose mutarotase-like enzyme
MRVEPFGTSSRGPVHTLLIGSPPGPVLEVLDLGATMHRLWVTGGDGVRRNVVLGHASPEEYLTSKDYIGGTIGRYANRIRGASFFLDGQVVQVEPNEHDNQLHGGPDGFDKRIWRVVEHDDDRLTLELTSPRGDQGYPGELVVRATFSVADDTVRLALEAVTDADTVVGLTSHTYFNLDGSDTVGEHLLRVPAEEYLPSDDEGIPLEPATVAGTRFDLRTPVSLASAGDLDDCYVIAGSGLREAAELVSSTTSTRMVLSTDQPGIQVYSGVWFDGSGRSISGSSYGKGAGVALEPQLFPDTPNRPEFGSAVLRPGETYRWQAEWRFGPTV